MFRLWMLPAGRGDCLWLDYGPESRPYSVLVDGGIQRTYSEQLEPRLKARSEAPACFELLVLTHIDGDHIQGALELIADPAAPATIQEVWFNGWHHLPQDFYSVKEAIDFTGQIRERRLAWNRRFADGAVMVDPAADLPAVGLASGLRLTVLSPTSAQLARLKRVWNRELDRSGLLEEWKREFLSAEEEGDPSESMNIEALAASRFKRDRSIPNGSSIALLVEWDGRRVLLAGDAHASVLEQSLRQLARATGEDRVRLDAFKLSHHGSGRNLSNDLLGLIDCRDYLFSTDGDRHHHPDRKTVARILKHGRPSSGQRVRLLFNYRSPDNEIWDNAELMAAYRYEVEYPGGNDDGLEVEIGRTGHIRKTP